jgi:hypothetical protein
VSSQGARDEKEGLRGILSRLEGVLSGARACLPDFTLPPGAQVDGPDSIRSVGNPGPEVGTSALRDSTAAALRAAIPCTQDPELLMLLIRVRCCFLVHCWYGLPSIRRRQSLQCGTALCVTVDLYCPVVLQCRGGCTAMLPALDIAEDFSLGETRGFSCGAHTGQASVALLMVHVFTFLDSCTFVEAACQWAGVNWEILSLNCLSFCFFLSGNAACLGVHRPELFGTEQHWGAYCTGISYLTLLFLGVTTIISCVYPC